MNGKYRIECAELIRWLEGRQWLADSGFWPKAHAVFCDPPYFLGTINKRFGKKGSAPASTPIGQRLARGFMGANWDGFRDIYEYQDWVTTWARMLLSFVYPGALLLCFGGTRTFHRLAAGLEDAGWIIADVMAYMYGSGFPKGHRQERDFQIKRRGGPYPALTNEAMMLPLSERLNYLKLERAWAGWNIALKPAYEPIIVARAPFDKTYAQLAQDFGTGAINVGGTRIPGGRWPSNVLLGCTCETDEHGPDCAVAVLDAQSGDVKAGGDLTGGEPSKPAGGPVYGRWERHAWQGYQDTGGASRFFYVSKAKTWEREAGLQHATPQKVNDGRQTPIDNPYQRGETQRRNIHPCIKPIQLTEYLARLALPPELDTPRRLLVPFAGVASEMIGAALAGWDEIIGIEQSAEYAAIGRQRLAWWLQFKSYDQAKSAWDAEQDEQAQREKERAIGLEQLRLFEGVA